MDERQTKLLREIKDFKSLSDSEKAARRNENIALGKTMLNYSPLAELETLQASIGYSPAIGYYIPMSDAKRKWLLDVINFNRGRG